MAERTLFIGGFPPDFKERDLFCMFTFASGFMDASLRFDRNGQITAFALFDSAAHAQQARKALHGRVIDKDYGSKLDAKMAQKEFVSKREYEPYAADGSPHKRLPQTFAAYQAYMNPGLGLQPWSDAKREDRSNPPCNTMFVGRIPAHLSESDLKEIFQIAPGYKKLVFNTNGDRLHAFVEFGSVEDCAEAVYSYSEYIPQGGDSPLNVSFARRTLN
eukprot:NODE_7560_length_758_cov_8.392126_g7313_i0.p1 GENE.NODE_7560_length_758_cov_8.392126_g7313_i0~~NODE_7560_length_758_cov_8.392126_g7313_i0.p1  ORF type:complete len:217 (-),score=28.19 NODE_7560_length_758_cov_8.392126_g7313_i0:48-698(-)